MEELLLMKKAFYNNVDPRRKQEQVDSNLVHEDPAAMANLSNRPVYHTWNPDEYVEKLAMYNQSTKTRR